MQIICTSLQTDNHTSTSPLSFHSLDTLPATQPTASKHWRHSLTPFRRHVKMWSCHSTTMPGYQSKLSTLYSNGTLNVLFLWQGWQPLPLVAVVRVPAHGADAARPREPLVLSASGVHARVAPVIRHAPRQLSQHHKPFAHVVHSPIWGLGRARCQCVKWSSQWSDSGSLCDTTSDLHRWQRQSDLFTARCKPIVCCMQKIKVSRRCRKVKIYDKIHVS